MEIKLLPMIEADIKSVVDLTIRSWRASYNNILDPKLLYNLSDEQFINGRKIILANPECLCLIAKDIHGKILGFSDAGRKMHASIEDKEGEIYAIYIDEKYQRQNIGYSLVMMQKQWLKSQGYNKLIIWTLKLNTKARAFYEKLGGHPTSERVKNIFGNEYPEIQYSWALYD
jgi:ribosomal protein S18 acetylase RimI-like enzyme